MKYLIIMLLTACGPLSEEYCKNHKEECRGEKGDTGSPGRNGQQGVPGPVGPSGGTGPQGPVGPSGKPGAQGEGGPEGPAASPGSPGSTGAAGPTGSQGPKGDKGDSCSVQSISNGAIINCTDGTTVIIYNGEDGSDAPPTPYTVVGLVDPCGHQSSYDEVLLRMHDGTLMAHYASGSQQFLTIVGPGNYVTTDGTHCYFTVASDLSITNEHN